MKRTRVLAGYTIVEVMIVLAVTGALFLSAMIMISGQKERTEFTQSARELESRIQDVMNDVSSGYYTKNVNLSCTAAADGPHIQPAATDTQGQNEDCIYIGRALQFTSGSEYYRHSIVGLRRVTNGSVTTETTNVVQAQPKTIAPTSVGDTVPNGTDKFTLPGGLTVKWVRYNNGTTQNIGTVAFMGELASIDATTNLLQSKASRRTDLVPIRNSALSDSLNSAALDINAIKTNVVNNQPVDVNPADGISICLDTGGSRHAIIKIGGTDRALGTVLTINTGGCAA